MSEEEYEVEALAVEVSSQPIELYKVLKIANVVGGGGEAKFVISEGYVAVNGELEQRKRRKMYDGDVIEFNSEYYVVICDLPVGELPEVVDTPEVADTQEDVDAPEAFEVKPSAKKAANKKAASKKASNNKPAKKSKAGKAKKADKETGPADQATGRKPISF